MSSSARWHSGTYQKTELQGLLCQANHRHALSTTLLINQSSNKWDREDIPCHHRLLRHIPHFGIYAIQRDLVKGN